MSLRFHRSGDVLLAHLEDKAYPHGNFRQAFPWLPRAWLSSADISCNDSKVEVIETTFEDNLVSDKTSWSNFGYYAGGGLYVYGTENVTVQSSTFMANGAEVGGGMTVRGNSTVTVGNSSFEGNLASYSGGGMVVMVSARTHRRLLSCSIATCSLFSR